MKQFRLHEQFYYSNLNSNAQKAYDILLKGFRNHESRIMLAGTQLSRQDMSAVYEALNYDHPEMFWPDYYKIQYMQGVIGCIALPVYFFDRSEKEALANEMTKWKKKVCAQIPANISTAEKVWMIYDYLARRVTYKSEDTRYSNTVIGPMKKNYHSSVCEGVAKAFKVLCDEINVPCVIVIGDASSMNQQSGPHAWNMVRIGNSYRHVDATWEISFAHMRGIANDRSFLKKDTDMNAYTWNRQQYPQCLQNH